MKHHHHGLAHDLRALAAIAERRQVLRLLAGASLRRERRLRSACRLRNLGQLSLTTDNVFSDGAAAQLASVSGKASDGFIARLSVGVAV